MQTRETGVKSRFQKRYRLQVKYGDLRGILQYVPQFRGRTFVVALDGEIVASEGFSNILLDLAVLRSLNVKIVLVHGAAVQIQALAEKRKITASNSDGTAVTDDATIELSIDAITRLSNDIMRSLTAVQIRAAIANAVIAHPVGVVNGVDQKHTGEIEKVDTETLQGFLDQGILPVAPPLGYDSRGGTLRVNSDAVALKIATALNAAKIIFVTAVEPDLDLKNQVARQITADRADEIRKEIKERIPPGIASKLKHAVRACQQGVPRVHLLNGLRDDALLAELFSNEGVGTMVFADDYRQIRPANLADVDEMLLMMRWAVEDQKIVERSREEITAQLDEFSVIEIDGNVVGCVAVHHFEKEKVAEIACLHVKRNHDGMGYGHVLVESAEKRAAELGAKQIFAFSTQAAGFFEKLGYTRLDDFSILPKSRREYRESSGRNSVVLIKSIEQG